MTSPPTTPATDGAAIAGQLSKAFRWESRCMSEDPFAGDFGDGEVVLSDKMVTARGGGKCHACGGTCEPQTRNRVLTERDGGDLITFRWCQPCCFGLAVYDIRPSILDARIGYRDQLQQEQPPC
jgi:hypothetical protein